MNDPLQALRANPLRVLSLFSGIGGLDLGLERAGMQIVAHSEVDPYASRVLAKHWPDVPNLGDIEAIDDWPDADVICGGFPCQDISLAGKGAGIEEGTRSGLWREYARAIRDARPRYVLVENVAALVARGLDRVLRDLATLGYDAWWDCVPAASVGAPHRRDRLFIVATRDDIEPFDTDTTPMQWAGPHSHAHGERQQAWSEHDGSEEGGEHGAYGDDAHRLRDAVADAGRQPAQVSPARRLAAEPFAGSASAPGRAVADQWAAEPRVGRVAHGIPKRVDRLRCLGNAVVPQVAQYIGELVVSHHERTAA